MRDLSSSGTFNRDLIEYSFGNGTNSYNLSNSNQNAHHISNTHRNSGIRISFDFAASDLMMPSTPISNCSTRQPSIASGFEIPIMNAPSTNSSRKTSENNPNLLTVTKPSSRLSGSFSNDELIHHLEMHSHSSGAESTLSAPEQGQTKIIIPSKYANKNCEQRFSSFSKLKLSKQKRKKLKAQLKSKIKRTENDENLNINTRDNLFLTVNGSTMAKKSNSYLSIGNILRRSFKGKKNN